MNNFINLLTDINKKFMKVNTVDNISANDNHYLRMLYKFKTVTLSKFAEKANITKSAATQIINKFIDKGYVQKKVSSKDKRVCYIELTENIKKTLQASYRIINKKCQECLDFLTKDELQELHSLLLKINNNL